MKWLISDTRLWSLFHVQPSTTICQRTRLWRLQCSSSYIIPLTRHFLSWIRYKLSLSTKGQQTNQVRDKEVKELIFWLQILFQAYWWISINGLVLRNPTQFKISESSPTGLGGFTRFRTSWRVNIHKFLLIYRQDVANNNLEFFGLEITL